VTLELPLQLRAADEIFDIPAPLVKNHQFVADAAAHRASFGQPSWAALMLLQRNSDIVTFTHRCSIAERDGCFQQRLFVCQRGNFRMIKRTMMKLGG